MISDNGVRFIPSEFDEFLKNRRVKHIEAPLNHPQSSTVERFNRLLKEGLKAGIIEGGLLYYSGLNMLANYHSQNQSTTGHSYAKLMFG